MKLKEKNILRLKISPETPLNFSESLSMALSISSIISSTECCVVVEFAAAPVMDCFGPLSSEAAEERGLFDIVRIRFELELEF